MRLVLLSSVLLFLLFCLDVQSQDLRKVDDMEVTKTSVKMYPSELNLEGKSVGNFHKILKDYKVNLVQVYTSNNLDDAAKKARMDVIDADVKTRLKDSIDPAKTGQCADFLLQLRQHVELNGPEQLKKDLFRSEEE